jgi:hypothetical protein
MSDEAMKSISVESVVKLLAPVGFVIILITSCTTTAELLLSILF